MGLSHYNVWFSFETGVDEVAELLRVQTLLQDFESREMIHHFRLLKNKALPDKTRLPKYHAIIEFRDDRQFALPFDEVLRIGIHFGAHGNMIKHVKEFVVEVFEQI